MGEGRYSIRELFQYATAKIASIDLEVIIATGIALGCYGLAWWNPASLGLPRWLIDAVAIGSLIYLVAPAFLCLLLFLVIGDTGFRRKILLSVLGIMLSAIVIAFVMSLFIPVPLGLVWTGSQ